ncbi:MAG TPA: hypothetical protein PKD05_02025 [Candidatus Melainabacteria bacterium]|nr:hypothetical protein [Candidatus Melainabacteria bacterium]
MAENLATGAKGGKKNEFVRAIIDLIILALLIVGAGLGGYWYGLHERVVPVEWVPKGTEGAVAESVIKEAARSNPAPNSDPDPKAKAESKAQAATLAEKTTESKKTDKVKYWLTSSGSDFIGYSITVFVNGEQVDGFFGPGKIVDISSRVKPGDNSIRFDSKQLGEDYNKHDGDAKSELVVKLVNGPKITEDFDSKNVIVTYKRNAAETTDFKDTKHFDVK